MGSEFESRQGRHLRSFNHFEGIIDPSTSEAVQSMNFFTLSLTALDLSARMSFARHLQPHQRSWSSRNVWIRLGRVELRPARNDLLQVPQRLPLAVRERLAGAGAEVVESLRSGRAVHAGKRLLVGDVELDGDDPRVAFVLRELRETVLGHLGQDGVAALPDGAPEGAFFGLVHDSRSRFAATC